MQFLKKLFFKISSKKSIESLNKNVSNLFILKLLENKKFQSEKNLIKHGYKVFSQQDEDGIIDEIFNRIGTKSKKFVEMGLETGIECNTTNLLFQKWSGLWIESDSKSVQSIKKNFYKFLGNTLEVHLGKISSSNVNEILSKYFKEKTEIDLLSIDIGVHTYHVLKEINLINPRVIVTEYNAKYGPSIDWKTDYDENVEWDNSDYYGASLLAFDKMLENYSLVCCNITGVNAFFIRKDQLNEKFEEDTSSKYHFVEGKHWLKNAFNKNYKIRIV